MEKENKTTINKVVKPSKKHKKSEYIAEIIIDLVILYVVNMLLVWQVPYLTAEWTAPLWILNISLVFTIVQDFLLVAYDPKWFRSLFKMVSSILSVLFLLTVLYVFPFDFSSLSYGGTIELIIKIITIIGLIGSGISVIVYFFGLFSRE